MSQNKIHIIYNGCQMRSLDAARLHNYFTLNNQLIVDNPDESDFNLVITCGVIRKQVNSSFVLIEDYLKYKGQLIVMGCAPDIAPDEFGERFKVQALTTKNLNDIDKFFPDFTVKFKDVPFAHEPYKNHVEYDVFKERERNEKIEDFIGEFKLSKKFMAKCISTVKSKMGSGNLKPGEKPEVRYINIGSGCRNKCAYCGIRNAIGPLKSKLLEDCLKEYKELIDQGYRNFRIIADDLGAYGLDINTSFAELLNKFSEVDKGTGSRWIFEDLNPKWLLKYKDDLYKYVKKKKIIEILCPLQSGNNRILKLMNREYDINEVIDLLIKFKSANPLITLISHAIVGFPSETEEEFLDTLKMLERLDCEELTILGYHDSEGILSHKIEPKIEQAVIEERLNRVRELLSNLKTPLPRVY